MRRSFTESFKLQAVEKAESFFHTLKTELVNHRNFETRTEAKAAIFEYIEVFYNRQRLQSSNGYEAPLVFEQMNKSA